MRLPRRRTAAAIAGALALAATTFLVLTRPSPLAPSDIPAHRPDVANGRTLFHAGSCLACHKPPKEAKADRNLPSGGAAFPTPIGTLYPQNLTPDSETGIGRWSEADFVNAMRRGLSPDGRHYFPAFPYPSYAHMRVEDVLDIRAYLMTLPGVKSARREPDLPFLRLARRGVGLWNRLALDPSPIRPDPSRSATWNRGAYLVRSVGHCGECHTPRNLLMIPDQGRALAGGPHPRGEGKVPGLRRLVARERYKDDADLALALQFGETYGYDKLSSGGMADIQASLAQLPEADLQAIAEYLVSLE
jgi:mono/diheme cytochrome c family protein